MTVFINEFHYDNAGADVGEFIEIAALAGTDLTGWSIVLYNGSTGGSYNTISLTGLTVSDSGNGYGFVTVPVAGLQNGSPDGMALVDDMGNVIEFLSYEGVLTAADGPAAGLMSVDVGVSEPGTTLVGMSIQRQGDGTSGAFVLAAETPGALNDGQVLGTPALPSLIINEVLADPDGSVGLGDANGDGVRSATDDEFVEIVNTGADAVDLSGMTISDGVAVRHTFADGTMLAAGAAIVVFGGGTPTGSFGGAQVVTASSGSLGLNNSGDTVTLAAAGGETLDQVVYGSEGSNNQSLTRDPDLTGDLVQHSVATGSGGALFSPGAQVDGAPFEAPEPPAPELVINEIHADPAADLTGDANGDGVRNATDDEFVEIVNTGADAVDLSGMTISDGVAVRHTFADGTMLAAGAAIVVFGGGTPTGSFGGAQVVTASSGSLGLNNGGDTVTLATAGGETLDQVVYGGEGGNNQSLTRDPDVTGAFVQHTGAAGSNGDLYSPGTQVDGTAFVETEPAIVINEVDADQSGTDAAEFIELFDGGAGNTSLDGLVVVLFNGNGDASYDAIDLTGFSTDADGYFVIGSDTVDNVDLAAFTTNGVQNGADAVALYSGTAADFPIGTLATTANLIDALVYDTNDSDDSDLLTALGQTTQHNEGAGGLSTVNSLSRAPNGSGDWVAQAPTPGWSNDVPPVQLRLIHEIQGSSAGVTKVGLDDLSPLNGDVVEVEAIVTAEFLSTLGGFYIQEEDSDVDADVFTSEGLYIFAGALALTPEELSLGDLVSVTGTVSEFGGQTQIVATNVSVISSGNAMPTVTLVDLGSMGAILDDDDGALDYVANLEAYEGMLISITDTLTVSELFNLDRFGEYRVSADGRPTQFTQDNAPDVAGYDAHLQSVAANSIILDDGSTQQNPDQLEIIDGNNGLLDTGDTFSMGDTLDDVTGVLRYAFDEYRLDDATGVYTDANPREDTPEDVGGTFKVASLNVLNFFTTIDDGNATTDTGDSPRGADDLSRFDATIDPNAEYDRQLEKLVNAIVEIDADVLGLVELENTVDSRAVATLVEAVNAALGSEVYGYLNTGLVGGDAIANGMIYKIDSVDLAGDFAVLESFEGRNFIDPLDAGRDLNRAALAQTFEDVESGELITIVVNHLKSKGSLSGDPLDEDQGDGQGNNNATRTEAAEILADWLASDPTGQGGENQMIIGDLNSYAQEDPIAALEAAGFTSLFTDAQYSYVFDGQVGSLDYIFVNDAMLDNVSGATAWNINSDEADAIDYNLDFGRNASFYDGSTPARHSDHDPLIAGFAFDPLPVLNLVLGTGKRDTLVGTDGDDAVIGLGGVADMLMGGAGFDYFIFGSETGNGRREVDFVKDYEVGIDTIVLEGGADILGIREAHDQVIIELQDDPDLLIIRGEGLTAANITIEVTDEFLFV